MNDISKAIEIPILVKKKTDSCQLPLIRQSLKAHDQTKKQSKESNQIQTNHVNKITKKRSLIKQTIFEVFSKSTMHGVAKIFNSKHYYIKLMWIIFLATSSGFFITMALLSVFNYKKYDVTTKVRTIYERPILFPQVTICNKNFFSTDYALDLFKKDILSKNLTDIFNFTELLKLSLSERKSVISSILFTFNDKAYSDIEKKKLGHKLENILIDCIFNNNQCSKDDFVWHFDKLYGKSLSFNW